MPKTWCSLAALAALTVLVPSCQKASDDASGAPGQHLSDAVVTLNGSGSSFQTAFQQSAIEAFQKSHPTIRINYAGGGSGNGRQQLADRVVDFAGTDAPYHAEDLAKVKGGSVLYFPLLLGPITLAYNLAGVPRLQLSPGTIAKIFQRDIKKWNDPAIAADNAGLTLPATDIIVARRSDGSGTTENFTRFLDATAHDIWRLKKGATVEWPADTMGGSGNGGVAQIVKSTGGAIGYVDLSDAKAAGLQLAAVLNSANKFVVPTSEAASAAGDGIEVADDLVFSALNASGEASYPITYQTWLLAYVKEPDAAKRAALVSYIRYLLGDGQTLLPALDYAPLPKSLQAKALAQLDKIQG